VLPKPDIFKSYRQGGVGTGGGAGNAEPQPLRRDAAAPHTADVLAVKGGNVREIVRTNDAVLVTAIEALLNGAGIPHWVLDRNMSIVEGSLGILPRRVLVADEHLSAARRLLTDAGLGHELRPDAG